ncbi:hypothetical protein KUTeg_008821 [Tegillarca granosa]|uniref:TMC domain-containing protein n=1 Tax=Tegillarca granosa TaxID=220873 RepID=A0ABQ9FD94_TEGGR|nr:hypothetical protein KUTeg_008821 [Tegillarca granosa]
MLQKAQSVHVSVQLPRIEQYDSGKTELSVTLFRIFFLRLANLIALIVSLYSNLNKKTFGCSGTVIGQEFYKLVVMDTMVHACVKLLMSFGKYFWSRQKSEFDIPAAVLVLIYRQGLVWVGTIACPVLPLLGLLSNVVFFYLNYIIVRKTCKPPIKRWNQSRNTSFLMGYLLVTLITIIAPVSVVVGSYDIIKLGHDSVRGQEREDNQKLLKKIQGIYRPGERQRNV